MGARERGAGVVCVAEGVVFAVGELAVVVGVPAAGVRCCCVG